MRRFVVLGHEATTDPAFHLDDLPGAGRLDILCRCVNAAFLLSHAIRSDVELTLILQDSLRIRFVGDDLKSVAPDERAIAGLIKAALEQADTAVGATMVESSPGIHVGRGGLKAVLETLPDSASIVQLIEGGLPVDQAPLPTEPVFILSDHIEFTQTDREALERVPSTQLSLGPNSLHSDHAITITHHILDTG